MHIIVASNNIFRRELSGYVLSEAGYIVSEAQDAAALLALLVEGGPRLVVADVTLARGDVDSLRHKISEISEARVLWLGYNGPERSSPAGAAQSDWLSWPYNPQDLLLRVARIVEEPQGAAAASPR